MVWSRHDCPLNYFCCLWKINRYRGKACWVMTALHASWTLKTNLITRWNSYPLNCVIQATSSPSLWLKVKKDNINDAVSTSFKQKHIYWHANPAWSITITMCGDALQSQVWSFILSTRVISWDRCRYQVWTAPNCQCDPLGWALNTAGCANNVSSTTPFASWAADVVLGSSDNACSTKSKQPADQYYKSGLVSRYWKSQKLNNFIFSALRHHNITLIYTRKLALKSRPTREASN